LQFQNQFLVFSREIRPGKNREISDILNSHNILSARHLQKSPETSIYKHAEIGKADWIGKRLNMGAAVFLANLLRDGGKDTICEGMRIRGGVNTP
jgi:hypothetical protein